MSAQRSKLSKSRWVVAIPVPTSEKASVHKIAGGDVRSLLQLLERTRSKLIAAGFDQVEVHGCYEIGYDGFWLHPLLEREGIHSQVLDSASILRQSSRLTPEDRPARRGGPRSGVAGAASR
jgi:transposase